MRYMYAAATAGGAIGRFEPVCVVIVISQEPRMM